MGTIRYNYLDTVWRYQISILKWYDLGLEWQDCVDSVYDGIAWLYLNTNI